MCLLLCEGDDDDNGDFDDGDVDNIVIVQYSTL